VTINAIVIDGVRTLQTQDMSALVLKCPMSYTEVQQ